MYSSSVHFQKLKNFRICLWSIFNLRCNIAWSSYSSEFLAIVQPRSIKIKKRPSPNDKLNYGCDQILCLMQRMSTFSLCVTTYLLQMILNDHCYLDSQLMLNTNHEQQHWLLDIYLSAYMSWDKIGLFLNILESVLKYIWLLNIHYYYN